MAPITSKPVLDVTNRILVGDHVADPVLSDGTASYTPGVSRRTGTETRYFHTGLKNTDSLTNPGKTVAASRIYDAFGNVVSSSGTWRGPFGYAGNFGYQQDASGLKLLGHRYYDPSTGRFLTRDPIKDGRNWYAYGAGEAAPTTMADPTGLVIFLLPWVAYALVAGVTGYVMIDAGKHASIADTWRRHHRNLRDLYDRLPPGRAREKLEWYLVGKRLGMAVSFGRSAWQVGNEIGGPATITRAFGWVRLQPENGSTTSYIQKVSDKVPSVLEKYEDWAGSVNEYYSQGGTAMTDRIVLDPNNPQ